MKTKLEMAHEFSMKLVGNPTTPLKNLNSIMEASWQYADAMQAEADKRKPNPVLPALHQTFIDGVEQPRYAEEWQPDWSQAPYWANWWAMDMDKNCYWYEDKLHLGDVEWDRHSIGKSFKSKHYGYTGDWRNSLRKRPQ